MKVLNLLLIVSFGLIVSSCSNPLGTTAIQEGFHPGVSLSSPIISAIIPSSGGIVGGTSVSIQGSGFLPGATVTVGGLACTNVQFVSPTNLTCVTPAHVSGFVPVTVVNVDTQTVTLATAYDYILSTNGTPVYSFANGGTFNAAGGNLKLRATIGGLGGSPIQQTGGTLKNLNGTQGAMSTK